jgi:dUTP pyrophosphatase
MSSYTVSPPLTLYLYVDRNDKKLREKYVDAANKHNDKVDNTHYPDAGFDLYQPEKIRLVAKNPVLLELYSCDMKVKAAMYEGVQPVGYYMYPRSSISKTPLRLANNVGIIDSGYRGNLGAKFDEIEGWVGWEGEDYDRLLQICSGTLKPFRVVIVDTVEELNKHGDTERGEGGFGSTGNV